MAYLDDTGLAYFWGKIKAYIAALLAPKANDADVVHRTGDETVSGFKSFVQPSVVLRHPSAEMGVNPSANQYLEIFLADKNYDPATSADPGRAPETSPAPTRFGEIQWCRRPSGLDSLEFTLRKLDPEDSTKTIGSNLGIAYDTTNGFYAYCPSTSDQRNTGNDILTRDWIPKDTRIVHTTGNETIEGTKTFQNAPVKQKHPGITRNSTPSSNKYSHYEIVDVNNDRLGLFEYASRTSGSYDVKINCSKKDGSATADLVVGYDTNDVPYAACPSFSFSRTSGGDIVTRSWLYAQSNTGDIYPSCNLNDMVYPGIYYLVENGGWVNLPSGWVNGTLRVYADASQAHIKQVIYRNGSLNSNDHQTCIRTRFNSTWSNWVRNVTFSDIIPIDNGGTGASDRLNAVKNLFNSNVGTNSTYFLTITSDFASAGYCSVNNAKTVLGLSNYVPLAGDYTATGSWRRLAYIKSNNYTWNSSNPSSAAYFSILMCDKNGEQFGQVYIQHSAGGNAFSGLSVHAVDKNADNGSNGYAVNLYIGSVATNRSFRPNSSDVLDLGQGSYRWKTVFAQSSTISTSDERLKTNISSYSDDILDAWGEVNFVLYKLKSSVAEKGEDKARIHSGVVAQQAGSVFRAHGIDPAAYGFFCFDSWDAQTEERDDGGRVVEPAREAGDQYSIRYEELLCIEAAYQRRENARLKKRVSDLEDRLAALELRLGLA